MGAREFAEAWRDRQTGKFDVDTNSSWGKWKLDETGSEYQGRLTALNQKINF